MIERRESGERLGKETGIDRTSLGTLEMGTEDGIRTLETQDPIQDGDLQPTLPLPLLARTMDGILLQGLLLLFQIVLGTLLQIQDKGLIKIEAGLLVGKTDLQLL